MSAALVAALTTAALGLGASPAGASEGVRSLGTFARPDGGLGLRANGEVLIDATARRMYQAVMTVDTSVTEFNLDTLKALRRVRLPRFEPAFAAAGQTQWLWALDAVRRRIFTVVRTTDPTTGGDAHAIATIDLKRMAFTQSGVLWAAGGRTPLAISYNPKADRLYLLSALPVDAFGRQISYAEERTPNGALSWEHLLSSCTLARDDILEPVIARSVLRPDKVYLDCFGRNQGQSQVVRLTIGANGTPDAREETFPALPKAVSCMFDPGSDRMMFLTTNSNAGRGAWIFDGLRDRFLGVIASGDPRPGAGDYAMGLDTTHGRLYVQTPVGLILADIRRTPLGAGLLFRKFAGPGVVPLAIDPSTNRVFAPDPTSMNAVSQPQRYRVLLDDVPIIPDLPPPDPDRLTTNLPEKDGVTDVNFLGSAQGFALRTLTTGGLQRAAWNLTLSDVDPSNVQAAWSALQSLPASNGTRDVVAGRVMNASITADSADASSSAVTPGDAKAKDLADHNQTWPLPKAECHDSGSAPSSASVQGADAECSRKDATVIAAARLQYLWVAAGITVEAASTTDSTTRDPARGVVSTSTSVVRGVSLLDRVRIGEIRAQAETWAHGRPGSAGARFDRQILDAWVDTDGDGVANYTCTVCDPSALLPQINSALSGEASAALPQPDAAYYPKGTPGGYQAIIRRDVFTSLADSSLNDDDAPEVPGLEIALYSDGRAGRTRQIFQFAAVLAESHYGIFVVPTDSGGATPVVVPPPPPSPIIFHVRPRTEKHTPATAASIVESIVHRLRTGWSLGLLGARNGLRAAAIWLLFVMPIIVVARRRHLDPR